MDGYPCIDIHDMDIYAWIYQEIHEHPWISMDNHEYGPRLAMNEHLRRAVDVILSQIKAPTELFNSRKVL